MPRQDRYIYSLKAIISQTPTEGNHLIVVATDSSEGGVEKEGEGVDVSFRFRRTVDRYKLGAPRKWFARGWFEKGSRPVLSQEMIDSSYWTMFTGDKLTVEVPAPLDKREIRRGTMARVETSVVSGITNLRIRTPR